MHEEKQLYLEKVGKIRQTLESQIDMAYQWQDELNEFIDLTDLIQNLEVIKKNFGENRFELVVVGEFSTGKSTFINALIGKKVLPSKSMPTTATVNFIRHFEQSPNKKEEVVVFFENGQQQFIAFEKLEEFVTEMSKRHSVVDEIKYVDVYVNSPYLEGGVVIVDTPGMKSLHKKHDEITHRQIRRSNASIFLFNINQAGTRTEYEFLQKIKESINRVFFVANRCDEVNEDDQSVEDVILSIEKKLKNNDYYPVNPDHAIVYPVSSQCALLSRDHQVTHGRNEMNDVELFEKSRFHQFEGRLWDYLTKGEKAQEQLEEPLHRLAVFYENVSAKLKERLDIIKGEMNVDEVIEKINLINESIETRKMKLENDKEEIRGLTMELRDKQRAQFTENIESVKQNLIRTCADFGDIEEYNEAFGETESYVHNRFYDVVHTAANHIRIDVMQLVIKKLKADKNEFEKMFDIPLDNMKIETRLKQRNRKSNPELLALEDSLKDYHLSLKKRHEEADEQGDVHERVLLNQEIQRQIEREEALYREERTRMMSSIGTMKDTYTAHDTPEWKGLGHILGFIGLERKQREVTRKNTMKEQMIEKQEALDKQYLEKLRRLEEQKDIHTSGSAAFSQQKIDKIEVDIRRLEDNYRKSQNLLVEKKIEASNREMKQINKQVQTMIEDSANQIIRSYQQIMGTINVDSIIDYFFERYLEETDETIRFLKEQLDENEKLMNENEEKKQAIKEKIAKVEQVVEEKKKEFALLESELTMDKMEVIV